MTYFNKRLNMHWPLNDQNLISENSFRMRCSCDFNGMKSRKKARVPRRGRLSGAAKPGLLHLQRFHRVLPDMGLECDQRTNTAIRISQGMAAVNQVLDTGSPFAVCARNQEIMF